MGVVTRRCPGCGSTKDSAEFSRDSTAKNGLQTYCKECQRERCKSWYSRNRERVRAVGKEWRSKNRSTVLKNKKLYRQRHPDRVKQQHTEWRAKNREHVNRKSREWAAGNIDIRRASANRWRRENPEYGRSAQAKRRVMEGSPDAKESQLIADFYQYIAVAPGLKCFWCGGYVPIYQRQVDHIMPLASGGKHELANLCCSCAWCNLRKSDLTPAEFTKRYGSA